VLRDSTQKEMVSQKHETRDIPLATGDVVKLAIVRAERLHTEGNYFSKARDIPLTRDESPQLAKVRAERLHMKEKASFKHEICR
jgi:hypothetical protein